MIFSGGDHATIKPLRHALRHSLSWSAARDRALPAYADCDAGLIDAVLEEAGRFAGDILSPPQPVGDRDGPRWLASADGKGEVAPPPALPTPTGSSPPAAGKALPCPPSMAARGCRASWRWRSAKCEISQPVAFSHVVTLTRRHRGADDCRIDDLKPPGCPGW